MNQSGVDRAQSHDNGESRADTQRVPEPIRAARDSGLPTRHHHHFLALPHDEPPHMANAWEFVAAHPSLFAKPE